MKSIYLPAVPKLSSTATQNTQNTMRIRKVQRGWNRRKGILPMILPTIRKSCTENGSLFLSTNIRQSRTTCFRKYKDKLLGVLPQENYQSCQMWDQRIQISQRNYNKAIYTSYYTLESPSKTLPMFSKSLCIKIYFPTIIIAGFF